MQPSIFLGVFEKYTVVTLRSERVKFSNEFLTVTVEFLSCCSDSKLSPTISWLKYVALCYGFVELKFESLGNRGATQNGTQMLATKERFLCTRKLPTRKTGSAQNPPCKKRRAVFEKRFISVLLVKFQKS